MNIELHELDEWARLADKTTSGLVSIFTQLSREEVTPARLHAAYVTACETQTIANRLRIKLLRAGADDPGANWRFQAEVEKHAPSLAEMTSEANKRLARLLREAAEAAAVVERERNDDGGLSEVLADYAEWRELECYGPKDLRQE